MGIVASNKNLVLQYCHTKSIFSTLLLNHTFFHASIRELKTRKIVFNNSRLISHPAFQPIDNFYMVYYENFYYSSDEIFKYHKVMPASWNSQPLRELDKLKYIIKKNGTNHIRFAGSLYDSFLDNLACPYIFHFVEELKITSDKSNLEAVTIFNLTKLTISTESLHKIPVNVRNIDRVEIIKCSDLFLKSLRRNRVLVLTVCKLKWNKDPVVMPNLEELFLKDTEIPVFSDTLRKLTFLNQNMSQQAFDLIFVQKKLLVLKLDSVVFEEKQYIKLCPTINVFSLSKNRNSNNVPILANPMEVKLRSIYIHDCYLRNIKKLLGSKTRVLDIDGLKYSHSTGNLEISNKIVGQYIVKFPNVFRNAKTVFVPRKMEVLEMVPQTTRTVIFIETPKSTLLISRFRQKVRVCRETGGA